MVIANSDSTGTLVSLDDNLHRNKQGLWIPTTVVPPPSNVYRKTALHLPNVSSVSRTSSTVSLVSLACSDSDSDDDEYHVSTYDDNCWSFDTHKNTSKSTEVLYLPDNSNATEGETLHVDKAIECLHSESGLMMNNLQLLESGKHRVYDKASSGNHHPRVLYVAQGEVGHTVPHQTDVLMSDRATTCHIVAFRSTSTDTEKEALSSICHIDGTSSAYEQSIYDLVQHHCNYHDNTNHAIEMDIHVLGGYADEHGTSVEISNWLMGVLADVADKYTSSNETGMTMTLQTCAISSINTTCTFHGRSEPIGRGFAICCKTGNVFLAKCDKSFVPAISARSSRLFSANSQSGLACVHTEQSDCITIHAFDYSHVKDSFDIRAMLALPDDLLLQYTSTSPDVEDKHDFCHIMRSTFRFLLQTTPAQVFGGSSNDCSLQLRRVKGTNTWKRCD